MSTREKRLEAIRQNTKNVRFEELIGVLEDFGFNGRPGKGDHWVFRHPRLPNGLSIDHRRPVLLPVYVRAALKAIDAVLED